MVRKNNTKATTYDVDIVIKCDCCPCCGHTKECEEAGGRGANANVASTDEAKSVIVSYFNNLNEDDRSSMHAYLYSVGPRGGRKLIRQYTALDLRNQ